MPIDYQRHNEDNLVRRAREQGGECFISYGETSAAVRLTERGVGHWEQRSPFVATFVLHVGPKGGGRGDS